MTTPRGESAEYNLLCCNRLPKTYLTDLYTLYTGKEGESLLTTSVQSITSMQVEKLIEPKEWLNCIQWSRFRREGEKKCLEVFITKPIHSELFYAVGEKGEVWVGTNGTTLKIHTTTVQVLCGESKMNCSNPKIYWIDCGSKN